MPVGANSGDAQFILGRAAGIGMAICGVVGAVAGLIIGLIVHPPTALFAMAELGVPAAAGGGILGLLVGLVVWAIQRLRAQAD